MSFTGLLIRDTLTDTGSETSGCVYASPDIIPMGSSTLTAGTAADYDAYVGGRWGNPVYGGQINNIYVRCENLGSGAQSGTVALYYSSSAMFVQPSVWQNQTVNTGNGTQLNTLTDATTPANGSQIGAGDVGWTPTPFLLTSLQAPPPGAHYCFIAISSLGANAPAIPGNFASNAAFTQWVESNPNVAWHNFAYIPASNAVKVVSTLYGNANSTSAQFFFSIVATNCPTGTTLTLQDLSCSPPVNLSSTLPAPDSLGNQIAETEQVTIPGDYNGTITVQATAPANTTFPANWKISIQPFQVSDSDTASELEKQVARPHQWHRPQADGSVQMTTIPVVPMGMVAMLGESGSGS